eukprot:jgi/Psemu1/287489/fgenesh1_pg.193_\
MARTGPYRQKRPKGGGTTKKNGKKKAAASATSKKKTGDAKKSAQKKQRISDNTNTDQNEQGDKSRSKTNLPLGADGPSEGKATNSSTSTKLRQNDTIYDNQKWEIYEQHSEKFESDASWNENYWRLQEFHSTYGHSGVPIHWSVEPEFADWVSRQRQIFREIHSGYRVATLREEGRWRRLQVLKFPLDYEKWHWRRKYDALVDALNGKKYDETDTTIPPSLKVWANHQKQLYESGTHGRIDYERKGNLEVLGIVTRREDRGGYETSDDW